MTRLIFLLAICTAVASCRYRMQPKTLELSLPFVGGPKMTFEYKEKPIDGNQ